MRKDKKINPNEIRITVVTIEIIIVTTPRVVATVTIIIIIVGQKVAMKKTTIFIIVINIVLAIHPLDQISHIFVILLVLQLTSQTMKTTILNKYMPSQTNLLPSLNLLHQQNLKLKYPTMIRHRHFCLDSLTPVLLVLMWQHQCPSSWALFIRYCHQNGDIQSPTT
jgi:hypothetical protein